MTAESRKNGHAGVKKMEAEHLPMDLFGDGLIVLSPEGTILSANSEARSQLGWAEVQGLALHEASPRPDGWDELVAAVEEGRRADLPLRMAGGRSVIARLRKAPDDEFISLLILVDVDAFDFIRDRAFGRSRSNNLRFLSPKRTRPDFATQRRLSPELNRVLTRGELAIRQGARIIVAGESGVGKSEIARFLHLSVADAHDPFVVLNCASASSDQPLDTTLFGRDGPDGRRLPGLIHQAEGGTLFLDEVAEIPMPVQAKLLWFLEDGQVPAFGAPPIKEGAPRRSGNIRIIAATNRDLSKMVRDGKFRADLYFRLAVVTLNVPPLRDMHPLVGHLIDRFLHTINQRRLEPVRIPDRLREILEDYSFPGNIRELLNIVQRIVVFIEVGDNLDEILADLIAPIDVPGVEGQEALGFGATLDLRSEVRRFERALIDKAIRVHGSKRKAAKALGINIGTIVRKTAEDPEEGHEKVNKTNPE